jgi:putative ABC transport system permease protein
MKAHRVVINEKAAAQLGFDTKENLVGKKILWGEEYEIAGVIKDYHHLTLRQPIEPAIYLPAQSQGYFTVLLNTANLQANLDRLKNLYASLFAGYPFEYFFADEQYDKQYAAEQKLGNVFISAACIAIFIGCMGLFGLAAFSARQRVKEIGIRKVLGATAADITALLSKDFVKLVVISIVIASPIAWWAMNNWLQGFAYRTNVEWWMFLLAGFIAVAIALVTISFQSVKSALANPVKNLRTE